MYTMMQVCRETNLTYETLKFYCNEGMVPNVKRDRNNRRIFDEQDVKWIQDLVCLKKCRMSEEDRQRLCREFRQDDHTFFRRDKRKSAGGGPDSGRGALNGGRQAGGD